MLETIMRSHAIFWVMGAVAGVGILCKMITVCTLKRLVRAAGRMGKSSQKLMKLVKAKFEHAFMLSDRVDNVEAFVEKYLYEYKVWGLRLHTYRYFVKQSVWILGVLGIVGMFFSYGQAGMEEEAFRYGVIGGVAMVGMFLVRISSDEEHQLEVIKTYMMDYLENICGPRYSKQQALKQQRMEHVMNETIVEPAEETADEMAKKNYDPEMREIKIPEEIIKPEVGDVKGPEPEIEEKEYIQQEIKSMESEEEEKLSQEEIKEEKEIKSKETEESERRVPQEIILREILEEFLA